MAEVDWKYFFDSYRGETLRLIRTICRTGDIAKPGGNISMEDQREERLNKSHFHWKFQILWLNSNIPNLYIHLRSYILSGGCQDHHIDQFINKIVGLHLVRAQRPAGQFGDAHHGAGHLGGDRDQRGEPLPEPDHAGLAAGEGFLVSWSRPWLNILTTRYSPNPSVPISVRNLEKTKLLYQQYHANFLKNFRRK